MKFIKYLIILICSLFFSLKVDALINAGINNGDKSYVKKEIGTTYGNLSTPYGYLGSSYEIRNDSNASAFCIDPGLKSPNVEYKYFRELDLSTSLDKKFYKTYLYYVNNLTAGDDKKITRFNTDIVLRSILNDHGYATYTSSATRDEQYFGKSGIVDFIQSKIEFSDINWSLGGNNQSISDNCNYWVKTTNTETCENKFIAAREYYNKYLSFNLDWENPLSITSSVVKTEATALEEAYYTFKFIIKFSDSKNNFFDYSNYNNGYNMSAYFDYSLGNINDSYTLEGNAIEFSGPGHITNNNNELELFVKISEETYNVIKSNDPNEEVFIKLNYKYYHPLSSENVYINSYIDTLKNTTHYQRMVIFGNYIHEDYEIAGKNIESEQSDYYACQQQGNAFFYNGLEVTISEYKEKCGCPNINSNLITNISMKNIYNNMCILKLQEKYSSTLNKCTSTEAGRNTVIHSYTRQIEDNNNYCLLNCSETINIKNYVDKYTVLAGKYFELDKYPELESQKECNLDVYYNNWNNDYNALLIDEINSVNKKMRDYAIENPYNSATITCSCGEECTDSGTRYYYKYKEYYYDKNSRTINYIEKNDSYKLGNCGNTKPNTNNLEINEQIVSTKIESLENHFAKLHSCNKYLNELGESFYNFYGDLNFYYEQTYYKHGKLYNDSKPENEDDDSKFSVIKKNDSGYINGYKEINGTNYNNSQFIYDNYPYIYIGSTTSTDAMNYSEKIGSVKHNDYTINRIRNYANNYEPSVIKYVDALTGTISTNKKNLENPMLIKGNIKNNVYDTHYTTISKSDNQNYYEFKSLGDNNEIYNYYIGNSQFSSGEPEKLKRYCEYEIQNELVKCDGSNCKLNIIYRSVDPINIDPNNRLSKDEGFANWKTTEAKVVKAKIEKDAKEYNTYSPENLEYSFTLDSAAIAAIRKDNEETLNNKYDVWEDEYFECTDGNKCESKFITKINEGIFTDSWDKEMNSFVTIKNGRTKWKEIIETYNGSNKYIIDGDTKNIIDLNS